MRIGYVPLHPSMAPPGDRRRFPAYAADRGMPFRVVDSWEGLDLAVLSSESDLVRWCRAPGHVWTILDLPDAFLDETRSLRTRARGVAKWISGPLSRPVASYQRAMCRMIERADAVVCSTPEQAEKLARYSTNVHIALDLHREVTPVSVRRQTEDGRLDLVWEGLFPTLKAIQPVLPALRALAQRVDLTVHLVTDLQAPRFMNRYLTVDIANVVADWGIQVEIHPWTPEILGQVAERSDLAIVPVDQTDPYTLGKPENRMRLFWRLGLAVLGSDSPAHRRACRVAGLPDDTLCRTSEDWERSLERYGLDTETRLAVAHSGLAAATGPYGDEVVLRAWDGVFESLKPANG